MPQASSRNQGRNGRRPIRRRGHGTPAETDPHSVAWLQAIKQATDCVRRNHHGSTTGSTLHDLEISLSYLSHLESLLEEKHKNQWKHPPDCAPPNFVDFQWNNAGNISSPTQTTVSPSSIINNPHDSQHSTVTGGFAAASKNPFAAFMDDDDDDDDESDNNNQARNADDGGDEIVLDYHDDDNYHHGGMDILRLVVRLSTSQADVHACMASFLVHQHKDWTQGATCLHYAILQVRKALELADTQISKWYENRQGLESDDMDQVALPGAAVKKAQQSQQRQGDLMQDADIVHVSIQSLLDQRQRYMSAAQREVNRLQRRLQPQWQSRDQARRRMGDRWTQNPHPKNNFSQMRRADEEALKKLQNAIDLLDADDAQALQATAALLMARLTSSKKNRYNGQRPTDASQRVFGFPDAAEFDWIFTGSADNVVEFFEKTMSDGSLVKLDLYFTTGTVKTALDHPKQGKTQLFAKKVTPEVYNKILENPRAHTNVRYKKKRGG